VASIFTADNAWHNPSVFGNVPLFTPVALDDVSDDLLPSDFSLSPNFPNPFNPTTTLRYRLPESSEIHLVLYNTLGQEVMELDQGFKAAGTHQLTLYGDALSSGVYIVSFVANQQQFRQKILLIK